MQFPKATAEETLDLVSRIGTEAEFDCGEDHEFSADYTKKETSRGYEHLVSARASTRLYHVEECKNLLKLVPHPHTAFTIAYHTKK